MIRACQNSSDVRRAWELLYKLYLKAGHILPNPLELLAPHVVPDCVMVDDIGPAQNAVTAGTVSVFLDKGGKALPFRRAYPDLVLRKLQAHGHLAEIGMLACSNSGHMIELLNWSFWFCVHEGVTHIICGVPPDRTRLYHLAMGFEVCGHQAATLHRAPVVPMLLELPSVRQNRRHHRFVDYFERNPIPADAYNRRYDFTDWSVRE